MNQVERLRSALSDRYTIERELGAGGMATVYLAQDLKHDRLVALKVLKPELSAILGAERFLAEIKTTAHLQHPHILPLHDSGEVTVGHPEQGEGSRSVFYVMPYVEGESLRERLERERQLPVADAVRIATEVAGALDYAHRHGVIHRDIKPENILLHDNQALVADFGIALAASKSEGGTRMTETGMSLGTPTYMSPEQAMGERTLDARTDIYSLGCVLYEMLIGDPPHTGSTAQAIVAKVLTEKPASLRAQRDRVPANVDAAVLAALEKLPADRPATAAEFVAMLADPNATVARTRAAATQRSGRRLVIALSGVSVVAVALAAWGWLRPARLQQPVRQYEMALDIRPNDNLTGENQRLAISPDGSQLAVIRLIHDTVRIWLRPRNTLDATPIPGSDAANAVTFSPDGRRIAFLARGSGNNQRVAVATLNGAPPATVADTGIGIDGVTWSDDGYLYLDGLTGNGVTGLVRVDPDGSGQQVITTVDTAHGETDHVWPDALPGGRGVIFTIRRRTGPAIAVLDTHTGKTRLLLDGANAVYVAPGYLVYTAGLTRLMAVPFDAKHLTVTGMGVRLATVEPSVRDGAEVATSASGTLMYLSGGGLLAAGEPVWVDLHGRVSPVDPSLPSTVSQLALSPDGRRLAIATAVETTPEQRLAYLDLSGGSLAQLAAAGNHASFPRWSADDRWIYYLSDPRGMGGISELWRVAAGAGSAAERISAFDDFTSVDLGTDWLVAIRYNSAAATTEFPIVARRLHGDTTLETLATLRAVAGDPQLSPDEHWLAYGSQETGMPGMHIRPFSHADSANWVVSAGATIANPIWSPDGRTLYYINAGDSVVAASLQLGSTAQVIGRRTLFDAAPFVSGSGTWALAHNGTYFLMIRSTGAHQAAHVIVIENAPTYLKRLTAQAAVH
jgi:eukaryotic-like serine/threonine-protein kinase